jgi:uncharacterized protein
MTTPGPVEDGEVPAYLAALGLPGLADVHVHFMPESMQRKVWAYFDNAESHYGTPWPVTYRTDEAVRLETLRTLGLRAIPALTYPHAPGMAVWLNAWCRDFAGRVPDAVHCATFYPEPGVGDYVVEAVEAGARLFKMHVQVGQFSPDDAVLDPAWAVLAEQGVPVVIHAGSAPIPGTYTGPAAVGRVLARHPRTRTSSRRWRGSTWATIGCGRCCGSTGPGCWGLPRVSSSCRPAKLSRSRRPGSVG